jgi:phospho-N-acetylmuramoyl-pentapeptide-transferase
MLYELGTRFSEAWGPLRLLSSHLILISVGTLLGGWCVWYWLPRLWKHLPTDRGRAFTPTAGESKGKPTGAGIFLFLLCVPACLLVLPFSMGTVVALLSLAGAMWFGYLDDASKAAWGQLRKGLLDLVVAAGAAWAVCEGQDTEIWLPIVKQSYVLSPVWFVVMGAPVLWLTMNATNCSDGVDGLAGTLTLLSLAWLGAFLYVVVGHTDIADYLLVPHNPAGARWAVLLFVFIGGLAGYLWHNAPPSRVMMGDAGSRFLGLLVGIAVLACGNPFVVLAIAPVVLINGGTGLGKIVLLRLFSRLGFDTTPPGEGEKGERHVLVHLLHRYRFPLHDHFRHRCGWSNSQVLLRFMLLQTFLIPLLLAILVKVR